jgi:hypothetical protein
LHNLHCLPKTARAVHIPRMRLCGISHGGRTGFHRLEFANRHAASSGMSMPSTQSGSLCCASSPACSQSSWTSCVAFISDDARPPYSPIGIFMPPRSLPDAIPQH